MVGAIGIDLGTTYSAVAIFTEAGIPRILPNREGEDITPSVVMFPSSDSGDEPVVGTMAKHSAASAPEATIQFVKRSIGNPDWKFDSPNGDSYSAEEISALILKRLKEDAELELGHEIKDAVITVPAYFDDVRRTATKQAGAIAGLNVLRVLNEPTAAALAYGFDRTSVNETLIVYDLGGGTFDVTALKVHEGDIEVLATDGDRNLGGFDFDNRILEFVGERIANETGEDILSDTAIVAELREKAEIAKRSLTTVATTAVHVSLPSGPQKVSITRDDFEKISADLMQRTQEILETVLEDASLTWGQIDKVLLVGGSTRMPMVTKLVEKLTGKKVVKSIDPDKAVALGAAIQGAIEEVQGNGTSMSPNQVALLPTVSDVCSQSLGVVVWNDSGKETNSVILKRNSKIPSKASEDYQTRTDNQTSIHIEVTEGEDEDLQYVSRIGSKTLPIPPHPKGAPVRISFAYDIDQTIHIEVEDLITKLSLGSFEIDRSGNLSTEQLSISQRRVGEIGIA